MKDCGSKDIFKFLLQEKLAENFSGLFVSIFWIVTLCGVYIEGKTTLVSVLLILGIWFKILSKKKMNSLNFCFVPKLDCSL